MSRRGRFDVVARWMLERVDGSDRRWSKIHRIRGIPGVYSGGEMFCGTGLGMPHDPSQFWIDGRASAGSMLDAEHPPEAICKTCFPHLHEE